MYEINKQTNKIRNVTSARGNGTYRVLVNAH